MRTGRIVRGSISSTLGDFTRLDAPVESLRLPSGNAGGDPFVAFVLLGEQDDLPHVLRVVRDLAQDCLHDGVGIAADGDGAVHVAIGERAEFAKDDGPAVFSIL